MDAKSKGTLLVVDDEPEIREVVGLSIAPLGFTALEAQDGHQALDLIMKHPIDAIVSDLMMPKMTGIMLLSQLRERRFLQPFIFLTAYPSQDSTLQALRLGAFDYLEKPFEGEELRALVLEAMRVGTELNRLGAPRVDASKSEQAEGEIQRLKALRYHASTPTKAGESPEARLQELFVAEATPQLLFCDAAVKGLETPDQRSYELGYLFRVMQGIRSAAESVGAKRVAKLADAAERFYMALRVRPNLVTPAILDLAKQVQATLLDAVSKVGTAEIATNDRDLLQALADLSAGLENLALKNAG